MSAEPSPPRISLAAATAIVIASMIGTGVFTSVGFQIASIPSGFPVLLLWVVGGVVSLCGALCYAELVAMMPRSGGEYHLVGQTYHPAVGF
ncbi:MAG: amino acid permease, partial [Roseimicrobium sp.]